MINDLQNLDEFERFPPVSVELVTALEQIYPDSMPMVDNFPKICHLQGQVSVVRLLKEVHKAQTNNTLTEE